MIKFFKDILKLFKYFSYRKKIQYIFFCENKNIYPYLSGYIENKIQRSKKILIFSFEKIETNKNTFFIFLETNIFRQIFFLILKCKFLYSSTPDLNNSLFQKTLFDKTKYIYIQHSNISLINAYNKDAFKFYDVIQVVNTYQLQNVKYLNKIYKSKIRLFKSKYKFLETLNNRNSSQVNQKIDVLIAPSWNTEFYKDNFYLEIIDKLRIKNISYKLRPHYMSFKKKEIDYFQLKKNEINIDENIKVNFDNVKILISDWSGIFIEYLLIKKKRPYLINTKKKILNFEADDRAYDTIEIDERKNLGKLYDKNQINSMILDLTKDLIDTKSNSIKTDNELILKINKIFY